MKRPFLCRVGLHRWSFAGPGGAGCGAYEQCRRCRLIRFVSFAGGYTYFAEARTILGQEVGRGE